MVSERKIRITNNICIVATPDYEAVDLEVQFSDDPGPHNFLTLRMDYADAERLSERLSEAARVARNMSPPN